MNPIERLKEDAKKFRPDCVIRFIEPQEDDEDDLWRLEVFISTTLGRCVTATWRPSGKFGITVAYRDDLLGTNRAPLICTHEKTWQDIFLKAISS